jgi:hypothetical protein
MTNDPDMEQKLTVMGKICLIIIIATLVSLAMGWIAVTGSPNPHGHPGQPELDTGPAPWTAILLSISAVSGMILFFASLCCSVYVLGKKKNPPSKRERSIAQWTLFMPVLLFIHAIILPPVMCYRCDTRAGLCENNLRLIDHAKEVVAVQNNIEPGGEVDPTAVNKFITGDSPVCPDAGVYTYNPAGTNATCSEH